MGYDLYYFNTPYSKFFKIIIMQLVHLINFSGDEEK